MLQGSEEYRMSFRGCPDTLGTTLSNGPERCFNVKIVNAVTTYTTQPSNNNILSMLLKRC